MDSTEKTRGAEETVEIRVQGGKFKQFDIVEGASSLDDHHYYKRSHKKNDDRLRNKIIQEWEIFREQLPDSIFVRANMERPDLLRALIIGPQGSPYHDGLFFFDIQFPSEYPDIPPEIHYCCYDAVSLNRYIPYAISEAPFKKKDIPWSSSTSSVLELLLFIRETQVYSANTLLNFGQHNRQQATLMFKEEVFTSNWNMMVSVLKKPPKCFEEFVARHFLYQAETILTTCKAYIGGRVKTADTDIPILWQENFDSMELIYYKLVTAFQKNGSCLENLCKLGIEFYREPSCSRRPCTNIITRILAFFILIGLAIVMYVVCRRAVESVFNA